MNFHSVPGFYEVPNKYPTFRIRATNRCIDPTLNPGVDPAGMSRTSSRSQELMMTRIRRRPGSSTGR